MKINSYLLKNKTWILIYVELTQKLQKADNRSKQIAIQYLNRIKYYYKKKVPIQTCTGTILYKVIKTLPKQADICMTPDHRCYCCR